MERIDKIQLAIKKGFKYNPNDGNITSPAGIVISKKTKNGYIMLTIRDVEKKVYYLYAHQFAFWIIHNKTVENIDHIDRNKTNNKPSNLRSVTKSQNAMNMSGVTGVFFCNRSKKWIANIMLNYKKIYLGTFKNKDDALNCYIINKEKYHIIN